MIKTNIPLENRLVLLSSKETQKFSDRTDNIAKIELVQYSNYSYRSYRPPKYNVYFKTESGGSTKGFSFSAAHIQILDIIKIINTKDKYVYVGTKKIKDPISVELYSHGYYKIIESDGYKRVTQNVQIIDVNQTKDIFNYYKAIADYALEITDEENPEPLLFLAKNYGRIDYNAKSALHHFFDGTNDTTPGEDKGIIIPFSYNESQGKAIHTSLRNDISVIEGPPGTGKTQTILNLIANILVSGKNCAIVSNNNKAIGNVIDKINELGFGFIVAQLGNLTNRDTFFESQSDEELNKFLSSYTEPEHKDYRKLIDADVKELTLIDKIASHLSKNREELNWVETEERNQHFSPSAKIKIKEDLPSKDYKSLMNYLTEQTKIGFFMKLKIRFRYKIKHMKVEVLNTELIDVLEALFYQARERELKQIIEKDEQRINLKNREYYVNKIADYSNILLRQALYKHYQNSESKMFYAETYKLSNNFKQFTRRYPVITSTTHSILNNAPNGFMFDYVIIDEASQADLLSGVLAMNCARKFVVVGDSKQLQQIDEDRLLDKSKELAKEMGIPPQYAYDGTNSVLKAIKTAVADIPTTLLREHYRCAPDIIRFCNEMFYDGQLIPLTDNKEEQHLHLIKTVPGNHARRNVNGTGLYNQREIDEIVTLVKDWNLDNYGVITPFVIQSEKINDALNAQDGPAATIHKYQGQQRDNVVISFVVNSLNKDDVVIEDRLYDFITNPQLLDVAVSRAKNQLYVIVSDGVYNSKNNAVHDLIRYIENLYGAESTQTSKIVSIFDYLYGDNNEHFKQLMTKKHDEETNESELLMSQLADELLADYKNVKYIMHFKLGKITPNVEGFSEDEIRYIKHPLSHVDFLFYNNVTKEPLFVVEVDGVQFHEQNDKQLEHDKIKDEVLLKNNIPVYRFKTNESGEEEKFRSILSKHCHH